jgi:hypothetical protein
MIEILFQGLFVFVLLGGAFLGIKAVYFFCKLYRMTFQARREERKLEGYEI